MPLDYKIRRYQPGDALPLSMLVGRTLLEENSKDYSLHEIERLAGMYNPTAIKHIAARGRLYVATTKNGKQLLGCGAVSKHESTPDAVWVHAVFTHPAHLKKGVGRAVMAALEADALCKKAAHIELNASLTAESFYKRLGYTYKGGTRAVTSDGVVPMEKRSIP